MIRFSIKKGMIFREGQTWWQLQRRLATGKLQLENAQGEIVTLSDAELLSRWHKGEWVIDIDSLGSHSDLIYLTTPADLSTFPLKWQQKARLRMHYINALNPDKIKFNQEVWIALIKKAALEINDQKPPCPTTVINWWKRYRHTKSITKLLPKPKGGSPKVREHRYKIFEDIVSEIYLGLQRRKKSEVVRAVNDRIRQINVTKSAEEQIQTLNKTTIYRWLSQLQQDIVDTSRLGANAARVKYRLSMEGLKVASVLERIEIDHTPMDLIVIDKHSMLPLGRPWLTLAIDKHSRMVMGFFICFNAPSSYSVLQCLKQVILPKDEWLARFPDIQGKWPAYGIPHLIAVDNGMDLHSDAFQKSCEELGIQILYCPAGRPETKGSIERFFRSLNDGLIHSLPGTVFSSIDERGDYPSEELACIDMETLVHLITTWIVDVYSNTRHNGIGTTPLLKWTESVEKCMVELPVYPQQLEVIVGIPAKRTVFHYGIELDGLHYNSSVLQEIRRCSGENLQVQLKYYEDSVAYIHVYEPYLKEYIKVDAVDQAYAMNMHREIHRLSIANARKRFGDRYSQNQLSEARRAIEDIVKNAIKHKKMRMRKNSANSLMHDSEAVLKSKNPIEEALKPVKSGKAMPPPELPDGLNDDLPNLRNKQIKPNDVGNDNDEEAQ